MKLYIKYYALISGLIAAVFYLTTLAPSVVQIDSGELATVQITLGIAHPTGYPLFTLLGYLFSKIPLFSSKIFQMNLLALLYVSFGVGVFTYSVKFTLDNITSFNTKQIEPKRKKSQPEKTTIFQLNDFQKVTIALLSGLMLAFSKTFWYQSTSVEVYSLQILLFSLMILFLIKSFVNNDGEKNSKLWLTFSFVLALGFSNHMTSLLILPATAYLYFLQKGFNKISSRKLFYMILVFTCVLIIFYSYLPIRASQSPWLNWGNPIDFERLYRHISGFQYQVWLFSSFDSAKKQLAYYLSNLPKEFILTLILAIIGLVYSFKNHLKFFIFNLIIFLTTIFYSINYDINDIDSYFLLSYFSIALFSVFGMIWLMKRFSFFATTNNFLFFILFPVIQLFAIYQSVDQSKNYIYEDYTKALLQSLPQNSIVFGYQWDYFISPSYYFQFVENYRRDVAIIDKELLRRSWYYKQISTSHPDIIDGLKTEVELFLDALKPFERKENYDSNLLETLYRRIMTNLVSTNFTSREFHITPEIVENEMRRGEFSLPDGYDIAPHLLTFKVVNSSEYVEAPLPDFKLRIDKIKDKYQEAIIMIVSGMLIKRAVYERINNKDERSRIYLKKALEINPNVVVPNQLKDLVFN
jgi:hypothetical protein